MLVEWASFGRKTVPFVSKVTKRMREVYVVIIEQIKDYGFGHPTDPKIHDSFFIPPQNLNGAVDGDKVLIEMVSWDKHDDSPVGNVTRVLGQEGDNDVEMQAEPSIQPPKQKTPEQVQKEHEEDGYPPTEVRQAWETRNNM